MPRSVKDITVRSHPRPCGATLTIGEIIQTNGESGRGRARFEWGGDGRRSDGKAGALRASTAGLGRERLTNGEIPLGEARRTEEKKRR
jgi:hypothetical protein